MILKEAIAEFLKNRRVKGYSEHTIYDQTLKINFFADYIGHELGIEQLTVAALNGYYLFLVDRKLSSVTIKNYITVVRTFLNWCFAQEYISQKLTERFRLPKAKQKVIHILTTTEIHTLLNMFDRSTKKGLRNYCICMLMLDCGLRLNEAATLQIENIQLNEKYMIVDGKGNKQRIVPIGAAAAESIEKYLALRGSETGNLFYIANQKPLTHDAISMLFAKLKKTTGIKRIKPHLLRHTFATMYLENGGNIYSLQVILGHTSLEMVKKYLHLSRKKILRDFYKFSPMDNLE